MVITLLISLFLTLANAQSPPSDGSLPAGFDTSQPIPPPSGAQNPTNVAPVQRPINNANPQGGAANPQRQAMPSTPSQSGQQQIPPANPQSPSSSAPNLPPPTQPMNGQADTFQNNLQFIYDPTTGRDPFKVPKGVRAESRDLRKNLPTEVRDPLQRVNLEKVQILGILWDTNHPKAMIRDGESLAVFTITKNSKLGPNQGIVTDIREGSILVLETFTNDDGDEIKVPKVISIRK
ncbi:MAG: pilus assembly protein PilP [Bdellovibrionota bacterium]